MNENDLLDHLSLLLGREAVIEGRHVRVVEILREGPSLVLRETASRELQDSLYGQPRRRASRHFQVAIKSELGAQIHPVVRAFLKDEEHAVLTRALFASAGQ